MNKGTNTHQGEQDKKKERIQVQTKDNTQKCKTAQHEAPRGEIK
jgi:hypothetical protein